MREPINTPKRFYQAERGGGGRGRGRGRGYGRGRGRPPVAYPVDIKRAITTPTTAVELTSFELQILQMADIQELTQNEIAEKLQVSQTSIWRYLKAIRKRIAESFMNSDRVEIVVTE